VKQPGVALGQLNMESSLRFIHFAVLRFLPRMDPEGKKRDD